MALAYSTSWTDGSAAPAAIPDRTLTIRGFDIIERQNAWAAVWLTRNAQLLEDATRNPVLRPHLTGFLITRFSTSKPRRCDSTTGSRPYW